MPRILGRLRDRGVAETNLDRLWNDVLVERADPELSRHRKLEALCGKDPDEADPAPLDRLMADAAPLGEQAIEELAADSAGGGPLLTAASLAQIAAASGFDVSPGDIVQLKPSAGLPRAADVPAWRLGVAAARALREQEQLGAGLIANARLGTLAGVRAAALTDPTSGPEISFALDTGQTAGHVVFRSKWEAGRRFELARLLGDRIVLPASGRCSQRPARTPTARRCSDPSRRNCSPRSRPWTTY